MRLSHLEIDPRFSVRLIERDDLDQWSVGVTTLNMQRSAVICETQDQTARTVFVFWVVLNHFALVLYGLLDFYYTDVTDDALVDGMFGKLILPLNDLLPDSIKYSH